MHVKVLHTLFNQLTSNDGYISDGKPDFQW